uniref:Uncharacterized protein orf288 n=1 Tax=Chlorokybus atmophyticus TaxID=3144 RepID=A6YE74_CHLAT|nr:hypothetical protein Chatpmp02 [Chlorokybus atmophyticus]ABO15128.1 hypothetical protein [Chlorokybus atmophyticus]
MVKSIKNLCNNKIQNKVNQLLLNRVNSFVCFFTKAWVKLLVLFIFIAVFYFDLLNLLFGVAFAAETDPVSTSKSFAIRNPGLTAAINYLMPIVTVGTVYKVKTYPAKITILATSTISTYLHHATNNEKTLLVNKFPTVPPKHMSDYKDICPSPYEKVKGILESSTGHQNYKLENVMDYLTSHPDILNNVDRILYLSKCLIICAILLIFSIIWSFLYLRFGKDILKSMKNIIPESFHPLMDKMSHFSHNFYLYFIIIAVILLLLTLFQLLEIQSLVVEVIVQAKQFKNP